MSFLFLLFSFLIPGILSFVFLPRSLRFAAELLGYALRRRCRTRRELLLARVANEKRIYEAEKKSKGKEDDEWEEIEPSTTKSPASGGTAHNEWSGIVGFFHPFW
jgi:alpha-1,2-mannosyltransferase